MSKTKTGLTETPKASPATPKVNRPPSRGLSKPEHDWPSPIKGSRLSFDRSQRPVTSSANGDRRSPKVATPPDKSQSRMSKELELQAQLSLVQEDLRKANELIALIEREKENVLDDLKRAERVAIEANEKLEEALLAQKWAEESSEIEKFRADELEQVGIESAQKKDEEWQRELENVSNQHALDIAALVSATQDLQRTRQELAMITDAKNQAMSHADDATRVAEIYAEKVEILSAELARQKALHESKLEAEVKESNMMVLKLKEEIVTLKHELEKQKAKAEEGNMTVLKLKEEIATLKQELEKQRDFEDKLIEKDSLLEQLNVDVEAAGMVELYVHSLLEEREKRIKELESQNEEAKKLERSASESLGLVTKQFVDSRRLLHGAEAEIIALKEKMELLETTIRSQKMELEGSDLSLSRAKEEASEMVKTIEFLKSKLDDLEEEKSQALNNEKRATSNLQSLLEERSKLINELEGLRNEEKNNKMEIESLTSALHEASAEARETKERLLQSEAEKESYGNQIKDLQMALKVCGEKYKTMLDDTKQEIDLLNTTIDKSKNEFEKSKVSWEQKEENLLNCVKTFEDKNRSLENETARLANLLKQSEEEMLNRLKISEDKNRSLENEMATLANLLKQSEEELLNRVKISEDKSSSLEKEIARLGNLLKQSEEETYTRIKEEVELKDSLKEVEAEVITLQEALAEARLESIRLKGNLSDKGNELQSVILEIKELRSREASYQEKVEELSKLLEEARTRKETKENGELTDGELYNGMLQKAVEFPEENGHIGEELPKIELQSQQCDEEPRKEMNGETNKWPNQEPNCNDLNHEVIESNAAKSEYENGKLIENENKEKEDNPIGTEFKMWEICNIETKDFPPEAEPEPEPERESFEEEVESKVDSGESIDQTNGLSSIEVADDSGNSASKNQRHKKKPLLRKFGSLLKKKGTSNQK